MKPIYPNAQFKTFCYIKSVITRPNIIAGDYSYYDDSEDGPESFEKHVTHHYDFMGDKLIIGKFVAIARGVEFVMNGANHMLDCFTTYPFEIIDEFKGLSRPFGIHRWSPRPAGRSGTSAPDRGPVPQPRPWRRWLRLRRRWC